ncbi:MAG: response regulator [Opitutaceae bacterium]|nr:response regulator [Opitutaceae bacterium]
MKILIIEDEPNIRLTLQDLLEINGHVVLAAADGEEGIRLAAQRPDFIFCDVAMPRLDGYATLEAIRRLPETGEVPFVFLTAKADRGEQRRGMALGADDYITKPFTMRDILDAIAARMHRHRTVRERLAQMIENRRQQIRAPWSHELLTPLTGVLGGLGLIEAEAETIDRRELKEALAIIRAGAERQERLSRKLIRYFELEQVKDVPRRSGSHGCDAPCAITEAAAQAAREEQREGDLTVVSDPGAVAVREEYLAGALLEVVGNAFRFSPPGRPVTVTGIRRNGRYRIEILDEGPGMTTEQRAEVGAFIQFERSKREQQGLGLGLAIARATATLAGGRLALEAGPGGRGLKVIFDLPLA